MNLAEKSGAMSSKHGFLDFILGLLSPRHAEGFHKSKKAPVKNNWWPTSPGYL